MFVKYKNIKDGNTFKINKHKNLKANTDIFHLIKKTHDYFLFHSARKSLIQLYKKPSQIQLGFLLPHDYKIVLKFKFRSKKCLVNK